MKILLHRLKQSLLILLTGIMCVFSCQGQQSKAMKDQQKAYNALNKVADGRVATSTGGWTMTSKINGKAWTANFMYGVKETGTIIGHYNEEFIDLPYRRDRMKLGDKIVFGDRYGVNINLKDDIGMYGANAGEMIITGVDGRWVQGTFHCTATPVNGSNKKLDITDGFFKIQLPD